MTAKAYGGQQYTSARRLVLPRRPKTRGRFHLFLAYEVASGRVRWAHLSGKDSTYACRFMRRVRPGYPQGEVWVALNRDPARPRKSRQTRRTMRQLGLRWISLPKGCPGDNPVDFRGK